MKGPFQSLLPGLFYWDHFNFGRNDHIRLSMVPSENDLREVLNRLNQYGFNYSDPKKSKNRIFSSTYPSLNTLQTLSGKAISTLKQFNGQLKSALNNNFKDPDAVTPLEPTPQANLWVKREDLTAIGAYKIRGALVCMQNAMAEGQQHFRTASTGNHALGVLKAAELLKPKSLDIVVPENTSAHKKGLIQQKIAQLASTGVNATLTIHGKTFEDAKNWCVSESQQPKAPYFIPPYQHPLIVSGQSTIGQEIAQQIKPVLASNPAIHEVVVTSAVAGGGLMSGMGLALRKAFEKDSAFKGKTLRLIGVGLQNIQSPYGDAIRVKEPAEDNQRLFQLLGVSHQRLPDAHIKAGMDYAETQLGFKTEGASGAALAPALHQADVQPNKTRLVVSVISGSNR
jgi:threonine dehydratase